MYGTQIAVETDITGYTPYYMHILYNDTLSNRQIPEL